MCSPASEAAEVEMDLNAEMDDETGRELETENQNAIQGNFADVQVDVVDDPAAESIEVSFDVGEGDSSDTSQYEEEQSGTSTSCTCSTVMSHEKKGENPQRTDIFVCGIQ